MQDLLRRATGTTVAQLVVSPAARMLVRPVLLISRGRYSLSLRPLILTNSSLSTIAQGTFRPGNMHSNQPYQNVVRKPHIHTHNPFLPGSKVPLLLLLAATTPDKKPGYVDKHWL